MTQIKSILVSVLLLAACAQAPKPAAVAVPAAPEAAAPPAPMQLPNVELSSELLYEFLLSEIAGQRGYGKKNP